VTQRCLAKRNGFMSVTVVRYCCPNLTETAMCLNISIKCSNIFHFKKSIGGPRTVTFRTHTRTHTHTHSTKIMCARFPKSNHENTKRCNSST
jgi:hypothetical protein